MWERPNPTDGSISFTDRGYPNLPDATLKNSNLVCLNLHGLVLRCPIENDCLDFATTKMGDYLLNREQI